jgi:uncharacterized RDD family membrane protein YckC
MKPPQILSANGLTLALTTLWLAATAALSISAGAQPAPAPATAQATAATAAESPAPATGEPRDAKHQAGSDAVVVIEDDADTATTAGAAGERRRRSHHDSRERVGVFQDLVVAADETVREVVSVFGDATVDGTVDGDVVVVFGHAKINGTVDGELVLVMASADVGPRAEVRGQTVVIGGPLSAAPGAKLRAGKHEVAVGIGHKIPGLEWWRRNVVHGILIRPLPPSLGWAWLVAGALFLFNLIIAIVLAQPVQQCANSLIEQPIRSFLVGLLVFVMFLPAALLLSATVVGTPLLFCALVASVLVGKVALYQGAGCQLGRQLGVAALEHPLIAFCLGTALFYGVYMIPVLGWVVWFTALPFAVGAAILAAIGLFRQESRGSQARPPAPPPPPPRPPATPPPSAPPHDLDLGASPGAASAASVSNVPPPSSPPPPPPPLAPEPAPSAYASGVAASSTSGGHGGVPLLGAPATEAYDAAALSALPRVGFFPRLGASALDIIVVVVLKTVIGNFVPPLRNSGPQVFLLLLVIYHAGMWVWKGTTLGGIILGLRCVRLDGRPIDWPIAAVRALSALISFAALGLGFFWASWNPERQSWHDVIAGTTIVRAPRAAPLI